MENILLGKVAKAMYKLSGKTLTQLSDEIGYTIDNINNLFYGRLQKPSYFGIVKLVKATGFTMEQLDKFMQMAQNLPEEADITEEFSKFILAEREGLPLPEAGLPVIDAQDGNDSPEALYKQIEWINEAHEKEMIRSKEINLQYVDLLNARNGELIARMEDSIRRLKDHYDHSVGEIKKAHAEELERQERTLRYTRKVNRFLIAFLTVVLLGIILVLLLRP